MPASNRATRRAWYELQGDEIMMNTKVGHAKEHNVRRDQRIAVCIEDEYHYVTLSGTAQLIDDQPTAQADIKSRIFNLLARRIEQNVQYTAS